MRLWIAAVGAVAALALVGGAGTASATVGYTPGSSSSSSSDFLWFVGRGDVISNFGKGALVPNLDVQSVYSLTNTVTCTYPDGAVRSFSGSWNFYIWGYAQPRYAPGNDQITGYLFGPGDGHFYGRFGGADDAGAPFWESVGCPASGVGWGNDSAIPRTAVDTGTISFYVN